MPNTWRMLAGAAGVSKAPEAHHELWSWGINCSEVPGVGNGTVTSGEGNGISSPVQIGAEVWTNVASIGNVVFAVNSSGQLFCWGKGYQGASGNSNAVKHPALPAPTTLIFIYSRESFPY